MRLIDLEITIIIIIFSILICFSFLIYIVEKNRPSDQQEKNEFCHCASVDYYKGRSRLPSWCDNYLSQPYDRKDCLI